MRQLGAQRVDVEVAALEERTSLQRVPARVSTVYGCRWGEYVPDLVRGHHRALFSALACAFVRRCHGRVVAGFAIALALYLLHEILLRRGLSGGVGGGHEVEGVEVWYREAVIEEPAAEAAIADHGVLTLTVVAEEDWVELRVLRGEPVEVCELRRRCLGEGQARSVICEAVQTVCFGS